MESRIIEDIVEGSLGAFDGAYSVCPRIPPKTLDRIFNLLKAHTYKLTGHI